ncbi:5-aminolevulic acid synthase [Psychromarinibacter sp. C21-152]|uniref:5-aminolevulic acid synthase n=1 Tax=Psychromarinibacter sediminicola TaxID=3033385 RepID=A0AAE3NLD7_9RHOB|nr:5-aminolevulic acid synthase [Psychromarinibacter sediminicola]MDF0600063.1 5-aminolevulic acid synthase [Psychromarinibacter sediminicola]
MRLTLLSLAAALVLPALAAAQPIDGETAAPMLFGDAVSVAVNPGAGLNEKDAEIVDILVRSNDFSYYGAIAFSPEEGLMSESLQGAFNFHDVQTASRAALAACSQAKQPGTEACVVAAQLFPRGYQPRTFQLSQDATAAFADYAESDGPKAIALSASTGAYGIGTGGDAQAQAVAECNAQAGARDCRIAVAD